MKFSEMPYKLVTRGKCVSPEEIASKELRVVGSEELDLRWEWESKGLLSPLQAFFFYLTV